MKKLISEPFSTIFFKNFCFATPNLSLSQHVIFVRSLLKKNFPQENFSEARRDANLDENYCFGEENCIYGVAFLENFDESRFWSFSGEGN